MEPLRREFLDLGFFEDEGPSDRYILARPPEP